MKEFRYKYKQNTWTLPHLSPVVSSTLLLQLQAMRFFLVILQLAPVHIETYDSRTDIKLLQDFLMHLIRCIACNFLDLFLHLLYSYSPPPLFFSWILAISRSVTFICWWCFHFPSLSVAVHIPLIFWHPSFSLPHTIYRSLSF